MTPAPRLPTAGHFDQVLRPDLAGIYTARAARLHSLSDGHDLAAYLRFAAAVSTAQAELAADARTIDTEGSDGWLATLDRLVTRIGGDLPAAGAAALDALDGDARRAAGDALVTGRFELVDPAAAPLLWAALSIHAGLAARAAPLPLAEETPDCPICGSAPVASVIHSGDRQRMRYLQCALCACEWHVVRAKCSDCGDAGHLDYLSFDTPEAVVRAECCGACGGYLKVVSQERDPQADAVADDLATLALDAAVVGEGFARSGFNPFALATTA